MMMQSDDDDFEPLFDYHRVRPSNVISFDEDDGDDDLRRSLKSKTQKTSVVVGIVDKDKCVVIDCDEEENENEKEEDRLLPPPDVPADSLKIAEDSTNKKLRLETWAVRRSLEIMRNIAEHLMRKKYYSMLELSLMRRCLQQMDNFWLCKHYLPICKIPSNISKRSLRDWFSVRKLIILT